MESYELDILLTSLPLAQLSQSQQAAAPVPTAIATIITDLQNGNYSTALCNALRGILVNQQADNAPESPIDWFDAWNTRITEITSTTDAQEDDATKHAISCTLLAAVASLYIFAQANLTGPAIPPGSIPDCPFELLELAGQENQTAGENNDENGDGFGRDSASHADRWAAAQLSEDGEDLSGRINYPQYLLLAIQTLNHQSLETSPKRPFTWYWWGLRATFLQQKILAGRSATLRNALSNLAKNTLTSFDSDNKNSSNKEDEVIIQQQLKAFALLECFLTEIYYGDIIAAQKYLETSCSLLGLKVEVSGALGMRTAHQREAKAQLVVQVVRQNAAVKDCFFFDSLGESSGVLDAAFSGQANKGPGELQGLSDESDVFLQPKLVNTGDDCSNNSETATNNELNLPSNLSSVEQAAVLAHCTLLTKGTSNDDLKVREAAAYAETILRQHQSTFLARAAALLQASRAERSRPRTKERALLRLEGLHAALTLPIMTTSSNNSSVNVDSRMHSAYSIRFPLTIQLSRELGESLIALGLVGAALPIFESLELWDNLILCYQLLDKKVQAEQLVRRRLEVTPEDPRLLCALGDLLQEDSWYERAWESSGGRNARAQRSLARAATAKQDYEKAAGHWEIALGLNPLHPEGWFSLGYCRIKEKDYQQAMHAFTRCVQMDSENGEAWNNLAAVHMHLEHWSEALTALDAAVKHKRDSWHTWDNFATVAAKVKEWQTAVRALGQVVKLSEGQKLNLEVLDLLVTALETNDLTSDLGIDTNSTATNDEVEDDGEDAAQLAAVLSTLEMPAAAKKSPPLSSSLTEEETAATSKTPNERSRQLLVSSLGNLLKQIAATASGGSGFWGIYARYYATLNELDASKECLLKRVRALQGGSWADDEAAFVEFGQASLDLCRAYSRDGVPREIGSARMHLRSVLKRAKEEWEGHEMYKELQSLIAEVEQVS